MESNISIRAEGIGKQYVIGGAEQQYESFRELVIGIVRSPLQKFKTLSGDVEDERRFWALSDIDFEIDAGEVVGVIGHNGAGKSTLLKVLSRITAPTRGRVTIAGQVASLLEVGTGFHPELTGRENIYLNGSILGMRRQQIDKKFDEIVAFADVEQFLDTPVKRYSSGMGVRLAFSVAAHLDSDVLLVDEVLAVGDQKFQEKCLGKLENVSSEGRTVLFVSHNLASVSKLCSRAIVLDRGQISFDGDVIAGISAYNNQMREQPVLAESDYLGGLYPTVVFTRVSVNGKTFNEGLELDPLVDNLIEVEGETEKDLPRFKLVLAVKKHGQLIFRMFDCRESVPLHKGGFRSSFTVPARLLLSGEHTFSLGGITDIYDQWIWTRHYRFQVGNRHSENYDGSTINSGLINIDALGERQSPLKEG